MFTIEEILEATGGELICKGTARRAPTTEDVITGVSTDSRTINSGDLFIALEGENFNGHNFVNECFAKGAKAVVVRRGTLQRAPTISGIIIEVPDTLQALGDIAHFHRMRFDIPVIGITGSNGKTTTKDMAAQLLSAKYKVLKSYGTFNNFIGVPLTILKLAEEHEVCVLEMGANHPGEIARLSKIAKPNIGVITNIGPSHLEFFKDLEAVAQAKTELFGGFGFDDVAVWNADDAMLSGLYQGLNCVKKTFGLSDGCDFQGADIEYFQNGWKFTLSGGRLIKINMLARHNVYNALAAIAVSDLLGVEYDDIFSGLWNFRAPSMRMEILQAGGITIINDSYNANPKSMESAVGVLSNFNAQGRRILVAGDMLELGRLSKYFHHQLGLDIAASAVDVLISAGRMSKEIADAAISAGMNKNSVYTCDDSKSAGGLLLKIARPGDVVLIKGSRAMKMENVCSTIYSTR